MLKLSIRQRASKWLAIGAMLGFVSFGFTAMAQSEPTLKQIYEAAQAGKVEQAQTMVQQVLVAHPNSAKAHFVQAELFARQGQAGRAREALVAADKLAPGLPFAKPEAVQALRTQLASKPSQPVVKEAANRATGILPKSESAASSSPSSPFPLGLGLALGGGAIAVAIFLLRKKPATTPVTPAAYNNQSNPSNQSVNPNTIGGGLNGPQTFGAGGVGATAPAYGQAANGQPGYGQPPPYNQPGYGQQPAGSGIGGKVMGGLAAGLAVGAGVMAAQAIGKNLMGNNERPAHQPDPVADNGYQPFAPNNDLGGQNFGVNDASSWDDGSAIADSGGGGGGGDWDA